MKLIYKSKIKISMSFILLIMISALVATSYSSSTSKVNNSRKKNKNNSKLQSFSLKSNSFLSKKTADEDSTKAQTLKGKYDKYMKDMKNANKKISKLNYDSGEPASNNEEEILENIDSITDNLMTLYKEYDPTDPSHLLIIDNSSSLENSFIMNFTTRRKLLQNIFLDYLLEDMRINYCIANPKSTYKRKRILLRYKARPPLLLRNSYINYFGIRQCLNRVAQLEMKAGKEVFKHIHIVTDGYYDSNTELNKPISNLIVGKNISADVIGNDAKSITMVKKWIHLMNGVNRGIRYQMKDVYFDNTDTRVYNNKMQKKK